MSLPRPLTCLIFSLVLCHFLATQANAYSLSSPVSNETQDQPNTKPTFPNSPRDSDSFFLGSPEEYAQTCGFQWHKGELEKRRYGKGFTVMAACRPASKGSSLGYLIVSAKCDGQLGFQLLNVFLVERGAYANRREGLTSQSFMCSNQINASNAAYLYNDLKRDFGDRVVAMTGHDSFERAYTIALTHSAQRDSDAAEHLRNLIPLMVRQEFRTAYDPAFIVKTTTGLALEQASALKDLRDAALRMLPTESVQDQGELARRKNAFNEAQASNGLKVPIIPNRISLTPNKPSAQLHANGTIKAYDWFMAGLNEAHRKDPTLRRKLSQYFRQNEPFYYSDAYGRLTNPIDKEDFMAMVEKEREQFIDRLIAVKAPVLPEQFDEFRLAYLGDYDLVKGGMPIQLCLYYYGAQDCTATIPQSGFIGSVDAEIKKLAEESNIVKRKLATATEFASSSLTGRSNGAPLYSLSTNIPTKYFLKMSRETARALYNLAKREKDHSQNGYILTGRVLSARIAHQLAGFGNGGVETVMLRSLDIGLAGSLSMKFRIKPTHFCLFDQDGINPIYCPSDFVVQ